MTGAGLFRYPPNKRRILIMVSDILHVKGRYHVECFEFAGGKKLWTAEIDNTVVTVGKNAMLDNFLAGSSYSVTGPYMGLISSASYSAISASDTMASHSGWLEAGSANAPTFSGTRQTAVFSSASGGSKALSAALSFTMTGSGTLEGAFIVLGSGAVATIGSTAGTLFSAGTFSGGSQAVVSTNVVNVSYSASV
jgi:hypothetical protein